MGEREPEMEERWFSRRRILKALAGALGLGVARGARSTDASLLETCHWRRYQQICSGGYVKEYWCYTCCEWSTGYCTYGPCEWRIVGTC